MEDIIEETTQANGSTCNHEIPPSALTEDDFVCINVCGMRYEVLKSTLGRYPSTLLGNEQRRQFYYVECKKALFFDRHRSCFEAILQYYQSEGLLIRPPDIPMYLFEEEVQFFELGDKVLLDLKKEEGYIFTSKPSEEPRNQNIWLQKIWLLFEYPDSCWMARIVALWSILVITISIISFCLETVDINPSKNETHTGHIGNETNNRIKPHHELHSEGLEIACIAWFTFEYVMRFISSPNKLCFLKSLLNTIDLVAILPYLIIIGLRGHSTPYAVIRIVRLVRVFRIFKLSRHYLGLQILGKTLTASARDLGMMAVFLCFGLILFSSGVYYAEYEVNNAMFKSIPGTFWYTLVTMTTVGYGDHVPKTIIGKLLGASCALCGVLTLAMVVPVIQANFEHYYKRERLNRKNGKKAIQRMKSDDPSKEQLLDGNTINDIELSKVS